MASEPIDRVEIEANGLTFTARVAGPAGGRPVLLLHGFPQSSWSWRAVLPALAAAGYRAVAPDQRGYAAGARPAAVEQYGMPHLVDDVLGLADAVGADTFDLVGHDWGGMVAWVTAARHPDRVRSLAAVSTPHPAALGAVIANGEDGQADRMAYLAFFQQPDEPERQLLGDDGSGSGLRELFASTGLPVEQTDEYVAVLTQPGALTGALNWYRAMGAIGDVGPVAVPTLYVWSTDDPALGRRAAETTVDWVTGPYRFEILDGVSHWVPEEGAPDLTRLLLEHLAGT
ncbi:MAG TPA: alpha/beta hydrolase [Acidimicrobiales bacterium]|nr:alpha/beta hydrolase [Acidimicrobiales bacterium]